MDVRSRGTGEWILVKHGWDIRMPVAYHRFTRSCFELGGFLVLLMGRGTGSPERLLPSLFKIEACAGCY